MTTSPSTQINLDDDRLISFLDELPFWSAPFGIKLLEKIIPGKNMNVLDIGFGTGFPLTELAMRFGDTCKIYGLDPWKAATNRAREKIISFGIKNVELLDGVAENIALQSQKIDLVVSNNGLNNVTDLDKAMSECARVLKPGGQLVFTMNLDGTMREFYNVMERVLTAHGLTSAIDTMIQHIYKKRKPLEEVNSLLIKHRFSVNSTEYDQFSYTFTDGTTMFRHFFIRLAFLGPWLEIVPENRQKEIFSEIEQEINQIASDKGCFRLSVPFVVIGAFKK